MKAEILFLGTGGSSGIPMIGCRCDVCQSDSPFNKRLRQSALLSYGNKQILIDAGPDLREQALTHSIDNLDAVILTHAHFDHIGGLDDLRVYNFIGGKPLPCLASKETIAEIKTRLPYLFHAHQPGKSTPVQFDFEELEEDFGDVIFQGLRLHVVSYIQSGQKVMGFRVGELAYISDIRDFTPRVIDEIRGVKILIVSALRKTPSPAHFNMEEAIAFSREVGAEKTWFTHIAHEVDHQKVGRSLPPNIALAYDGLTIDFELAKEDIV